MSGTFVQCTSAALLSAFRASVSLQLLGAHCSARSRTEGLAPVPPSASVSEQRGRRLGRVGWAELGGESMCGENGFPFFLQLDGEGCFFL